ncbi:MAG: phage portal protein [Cellulosilyticaceae bacterium]
MGVGTYLKGIFTDKKLEKLYAKIMNDSTPIFTEFGNDVYLSDFVNNCIDRIATEVSKIDIVSVVQKTNTVQQQNDDITRLFRFKPNPLQTTKDFLACCEWLRRKNNHCFIYPQYINVQGSDGIIYRKYIAFYPLNPTYIEFGVDDNNIWEVKFYFQDGSSYILPYDELIHLKWRRGKNTIAGGGDDEGQPNTTDLLGSVKTLNKAMQGLPLALEASMRIKGVYHAKSVIDADKLRAARDDFESHMFSTKSGIVATDLTGDFTPMNITPAKIEDSVLKFLKSIIRERYGISDAILSGDYTGEQHGAFYQSCLEDFIIEFEQATSSTVFSKREQDVGHRIKCYYNKVAYYSTQNKIEIAKISTETGLMSLNQINDMFGVQPFDGGDRRLQSLNYTNVELVDKYQLGKAGVASEK